MVAVKAKVMQPYLECPSFERCSCNLCPLDPDFRDKEAMPGEERCKAIISKRLEIAKKYPGVHFQFNGLTSKEYSKHKRSLAMQGHGLL